MADNVKSKSIDSDKAALGRKLLNKHQKSKTARGSANGKSHKDHNEEQMTKVTPISSAETTPLVCNTSEIQLDVDTIPIRQYFNITNKHNTTDDCDLKFFDLDRVTIDDPELKHNEIYNLHINDFKLEDNEVAVTQTVQERHKDELITSNIAESTPSYDDSQCSPLAQNIVTSNDNISRLEHQLALDSLQSQLQSQVLTNSHLLGENSHLQAELQHAHSLTTQHYEQIVFIKQRLESTEVHLAESQRQIEASRHIAEQRQIKANEDEQLLSKVQKERDAAVQDGSELLETLENAQRDGERVKQIVDQLRAQLDMANIKIEQLLSTNVSNEESMVGNDAVQQRQLLLEKQLADAEVALETVRAERDIATQQYQLYNSELCEQMTALQAEVITLRANTEQFVGRERDLVAHIGDMERLLQQCNSNKPLIEGETTVASSNDGDGDSSQVRVELEQLRQQCSQLQERLRNTCAERDEALKEMQQLHGTAEELYELRNMQQVDSTAQARLLEEIRSDKVAASRAIEQNLVLKAQVTEIEAAYLSVTQDKVAPLTDQLATAKHQLQVHERNLRTLQDAIQMKDRELEQMRICETQITHLTDRLRHYEAQTHATSSIQAELQQMQLENEELRQKLQQHHHHDHHHHHTDTESNGGRDCKEDADREDVLQQEIFQLKQQLDELRCANVDVVMVVDTVREDEDVQQKQEQDQVQRIGVEEEGELLLKKVPPRQDNATDIVSCCLSKATATQQLERKFTRTMAELAALDDEKQRLEHLVLQLQGETETIGEYVALYQRQRSLLAQRTAAREIQLRHLHGRLAELTAILNIQNGAGMDEATKDTTPHHHQRIMELLRDIDRSNTELMQHSSDVVMEEQQEEEGGLLVNGRTGVTVACGSGCAWCQGKLITV